MNVLLIAYYTPPLLSGGSHRPLQIAGYLRNRGHRVTILTSSYRGSDQFDPGNEIRIHDPSHNLNRRGKYQVFFWMRRIGVEIGNRLGTTASIYGRWKRRIVQSAPAILEKTRPDCLLASYPPLEDLETGLFLSRQFSVPLISDFRDGLLFEPIESHRLHRFPVLQKHYRRLEQQIVRESSHIITASAPITRYFQERYRREAQTLLNGYQGECKKMTFRSLASSDPASPFRIIHTGQWKLSDAGIDIRPFFGGIRRLLRDHPALADRLRIHLAGRLSAPEKNLIRDLVRSGVVIQHGPVSHPRALRLQQTADLLLTITSPNRKSTISSKFFEYLRAGRPILALTAGTEQERILRETGAGWHCPPDHIDSIARLLGQIIRRPGFYRSLSPDPAALERYRFENQARILDRILAGKKT